jgi:hypothetical protein
MLGAESACWTLAVCRVTGGVEHVAGTDTAGRVDRDDDATEATVALDSPIEEPLAAEGGRGTTENVVTAVELGTAVTKTVVVVKETPDGGGMAETVTVVVVVEV